jgi:hypothetical protein
MLATSSSLMPLAATREALQAMPCENPSTSEQTGLSSFEPRGTALQNNSGELIRLLSWKEA